MHNNRPGCLSPLAILSAIVTLVVIVAAEILGGNSMFAAGALNTHTGPALGGQTSHAGFSQQCELCHAAPWSAQKMADRCLACHTKIRAEMADAAQLHGAIVAKNPASACRACHPEHRGPNAALTLASGQDFPHEVVGYSLAAHQNRSPGLAFTCRDCHNTDLTTFKQSICTDCHQQRDPVFTTAHAIEFGDNCLVCHDGVDRFGDFDHGRVTFALTGKHLGVVCSKCHLNARTVPDLQKTATACGSCHQKDDAHRGKFGQDCGKCHNPNGWKDNVKFDHNLADFKLEGEHAEVACAKCHANGQFAGTPQECFACHQEQDEHQGQFGPDCAICHNPVGWGAVQVNHDLFAFKLDGAHVRVDCAQCHQNGVFKDTPSACFACHKQDDQHNGRFGAECSACHSTTAWKPATFDHNKSKFPLTGAHVRVICENCHKNGQFQGTSPVCAACHGNPAFHTGLFGDQACSACHTTTAWVPGLYKGPHPGIADEGGSGVNHGGKGCRSCHTVNLNTATCTQCHDKNNPGEGD